MKSEHVSIIYIFIFQHDTFLRLIVFKPGPNPLPYSGSWALRRKLKPETRSHLTSTERIRFSCRWFEVTFLRTRGPKRRVHNRVLTWREECSRVFRSTIRIQIFKLHLYRNLWFKSRDVSSRWRWRRRSRFRSDWWTLWTCVSLCSDVNVSREPDMKSFFCTWILIKTTFSPQLNSFVRLWRNLTKRQKNQLCFGLHLLPSL